MKRPNISVCIATFNGSNYIKQQLDSIFDQLIEGDEVVIVDDFSTDDTIRIIETYNPSFIRLFINDRNLGVNKSFERAIRIATKEFIFLSDQDDIWTENRLFIMLNNLITSQSLTLFGNSIYIDKLGNNLINESNSIKHRQTKSGLIDIFNLFSGKVNYFGCCLCFSREITNIIIPFPKYIESHDLWIAKAGILLNKNYYLDEPVLKRRIHGNNLSVVNRKILYKIYSRFIFLLSIIHILLRIFLRFLRFRSF
jgi:glycosyltransferase involved in cell wall biosynthesis